MSNQAIDVEILGKLTRVNCPTGQEESLVAAAKDLDRRLKEMSERT
ncbi:cell division protein ZapA, partial [Escherichia coli]|nr:cell division protein ZapA [Escherichia coli]MCV5868707.1 cell division protein ZapA [Escherichia coli]